MLVNNSKKYEANCFLKMFLDTGKCFYWIKHLKSDNNSTSLTDSCPGCGRPHTHTARPVA